MRIPVAEVMRISVECSTKDCRTEVIIDLSGRRHFATDDPVADNFKIEWKSGKDKLVSPICNNAFDRQFTTAVDHFVRWMDAVKASKEKVSFRVQIDDRSTTEIN